MSDLLGFISNIFGSFFDSFEFLASALLNDMPSIFGLQLGRWVLILMATGILIGDFFD